MVQLAMGKYDTASKKIVNIYNQAWAEWVLQSEQIQVEEELSGEFQFIARSNDSLLKVIGKAGPFLVLTELQFVYDKTMANRLTTYKMLAGQKYGLEVFVTVLYFLPPSGDEEIVTAYHNEFMGQVTHADFQVIKIWELDATQVLGYNNPMLIPFVPLMQGGNTEEVLRKCAGRIRQESKAEAAELETILAVFAGYVLNPEIIKQILRWEMQIIQESPIMQEVKEVWFEKGIEKGIEKGEEKATIKALNQTLSIRFKFVSGKLDEQFKELNLESLQELNEIALKAQSLADFERALTKIVSQTKEKEIKKTPKQPLH